MNTLIKTTDGNEYLVDGEKQFDEIFLEINAIKNSKDDSFFHFEEQKLKRIINVNYIIAIEEKPVPQFRSFRA